MRTLQPKVLNVLCWGLLLLLSSGTKAQCFGTEQFPATTTVPDAAGALTVISPLNFAGDYALVALTAGHSYRFSSSVATDHITVSTAVASGAVAFGTQPVLYTAAATQAYFVHFHTNASCGTQTIVRTTRVQRVYCSAGTGACGGTDESISRVTIGAINNLSGGCGSGGYADFSTQISPLSTGQSESITVVNTNPFAGDQVRVFVDWNRNFNLADAGEQFTLSTTDNITFTGSITAPPGTLPGNVRMRVRLAFTGAVPACGNTSFGEVEDYTLSVCNSFGGGSGRGDVMFAFQPPFINRFGGGIGRGDVQHAIQGPDPIVLSDIGGNTSFCQGESFQVAYVPGGSYNPGNTFTVQLSNAAGSFTSPVPVDIGSVTSTGSGSVSCLIPVTTPAGTGYRLRVVSSNPVRTGFTYGPALTVIAGTMWYADVDGDGFGNPAATLLACSQPNGYVANNTDNCPTDPLKTAPGICDCGVADTDSDSDGTANCTDGCPNDPNKITAGQCGCGVADVLATYYTDADSDGFGDPASPVAGFTCTTPNGTVANNTDNCPTDALKTAPGICGCGIADADSDGDGTANCNDGCPNDPNKITVGICGCGIADTDSDSDGTANCNDGCPTDPLKTVPGICGCGVADTDSDNDGTANCNDGCPTDPAKTTPGGCGCGNVDIPTTWYIDADGDGFGNPGASIPGFTCAQPPGHVANNTDCNDAQSAAYTGAVEICDGIDNDCDGAVDTGIALHFDGQDDHVAVGSWFQEQVFTIEMWLKPGTTQNQYANIVDNNHSNNIRWVCQQDGSITNQYYWAVASGGSPFVTFTLQPGNWQHLALVKGSSFVSVYVNGNLWGTAPSSGPISGMGAGDFVRVGQWGFGTRAWNGLMDDVRFWNTARTGSEIQAGMQQSLSGPLPGLLASYRMNDGVPNSNNTAVTACADASGNGHAAPLVGFARTGLTSNFISDFADSDADGFVDCADNCPTIPGQIGSTCDDGNTTTSNDVLTAECVCAGTAANLVRVAARVFLEGPYVSSLAQMGDALRTMGLVPTTEPYSGLGYAHLGGGGETTTPGVLAAGGTDAIVDWVLLELRSSADPANVLATRSALVQRDGDVVDVDGTSPVSFNMPPGSYHLAALHRNHLACLTANAISLSASPQSVDLTNSNTPTFGTEARKSTSGKMVLWAGDVTFDGQLIYTGQDNDRDPILSAIGGTVPTATISGYRSEDVNLDGTVIYTGQDNDRDPILQNIGGTVPTAIREAQLP